MEVTLEKIDLIRERTGISYADAKDALVESGGDVVEALVQLEKRDGTKQASNSEGENHNGSMECFANDVMEKLRSLWAKGTDTKVKITRGEETLFDLPLTAGLLGTLLAPQAALAGAIVAYASKCSIAIEKGEKTDKVDADIAGQATAEGETHKCNCTNGCSDDGKGEGQ